MTLPSDDITISVNLTFLIAMDEGLQIEILNSSLDITSVQHFLNFV